MIRRLILTSLLAILTISPASFHLYQVDEMIQPIEVRQSSEWESVTTGSLLDFYFGNAQDCLEYHNESVKINDCQTGEIKWQSGENWQVREAITADLNRDGKNELAMMVWRPFKPWAIDSFLPHGGRIVEFQDSHGMSCHIILVGWDGEDYRELWAGSSLIDPVFHIRAADVDQDGNQELITLEGKYDTLNQTGNLTVWDWNSFGFILRDRSEIKSSSFGIVSIDQDVMVITN